MKKKNEKRVKDRDGYSRDFGFGIMDGVGALRDIPAGLLCWLIYFAFFLPTTWRISLASIPEAGRKSPFL